jgi:phosphohistidine swiveling domain-containing protein
MAHTPLKISLHVQDLLDAADKLQPVDPSWLHKAFAKQLKKLQEQKLESELYSNKALMKKYQEGQKTLKASVDLGGKDSQSMTVMFHDGVNVHPEHPNVLVYPLNESSVLMFDNPSEPVTIPSSDANEAKKGDPMTIPDSFPIYRFGGKADTDGDASMKEVLGGKGANLAEMSKLGISVPPGFTLSTEACMMYLQEEGECQAALINAITQGDAFLTEKTGYPPLVSVRSGARVSMPGMMDTILNVGLTDETMKFWRGKIGDRAAYDSYRRLIQMFGNVVFDIPHASFEELLQDFKKSEGVESDSKMSASAMAMVVKAYKDLFQVKANIAFPQTREEQLLLAVAAVFRSWNNPRAQEYRKINSIPYQWGTAATVQSMVFGNMDDNSCTGVLFTRNPSTGEAKITGEYLVNAQGEDVVAGIRTPEPLDTMTQWSKKLSNELAATAVTLEKHYKDMQDIEFTVQSGKLYILQTRNAKRSALAAFQVAYDLVQDGTISKGEAVQRITSDQLITLMRPQVDPSFKTKPDLVGIAAGGTLASGVAVFSSADAVNCKEPCILISEETTPDDIAGINAAVGILTATGGLTSHAAVVARGMDKTCVVGATDLEVGSSAAFIGSKPIKPGMTVTLDGMTGNVWIDTKVPVIDNSNMPVARIIAQWAAGEMAERIDPSNMIQGLKDTSSDVVYLDGCFLKPSTELVQAIKGCKAKTIIIDFSPVTEHYAKPDLFFVNMFGYTPKVYQEDQTQLLLSMAETEWGPVKDKLVFKLSPMEKLSLRKIVTSEGFKVVGSINTVEDLINATGPLTVPPNVIQSVFGSEQAYLKIKELLGKKDSALPPPKYWFEPITHREV